MFVANAKRLKKMQKAIQKRAGAADSEDNYGGKDLAKLNRRFARVAKQVQRDSYDNQDSDEERR